MSRDLDLTRQLAQPCVCCGEATDASVYIVNQKVPMCPGCSIRFEDYLAEKHRAPLPCPPVLYRYRAPNDFDPGNEGGPSRFEQFLTTDQVWASNPTQFNDPYDCRQTYDFVASPEEWKKRSDEGIVGRLSELLRAAGKLPRQWEEELKALGTKLKNEAKYNDPAIQAGMGRQVQESLDKARDGPLTPSLRLSPTRWPRSKRRCLYRIKQHRRIDIVVTAQCTSERRGSASLIRR